MTSSKAAAATAMRNAREWVAERWPRAPVEKARRTLQIIAPGKYRSKEEDLFGVADLLVLPQRERPVLIQVTTAKINASSAKGSTNNAAPRRDKLEAWLREWYGDTGPYPVSAYVIAWVAKRPKGHFRVWFWGVDHFGAPAWIEARPMAEVVAEVNQRRARPRGAAAPPATEAPPGATDAAAGRSSARPRT